MSAKSSITALALVLGLGGALWAQGDQYDGALQARDGQVFLAVGEDAVSYPTTVTGGFPSQYAFAYISDAFQNFTLGLGPGIGELQMSIWNPVGFILGVTDGTGALQVNVPKPTVPLGSAEGATMYAQVVSMYYSVWGTPPSYSFSFRVSNPVSFTMRQAQ